MRNQKEKGENPEERTEKAREREKKERCETMYGKAIFHNVFPKCVSQCSVGADPPLRPVHVFSRRRLTSLGVRGGLCHSP